MFKGKGILLAENDDDDSEFFEEAMRTIAVDAKLIRVRDGIELMETLLQTELQPDLIFLDINMPRKNGFQCLTEIRLSEMHKELPVVVFSTSSTYEIVSYMFNSGANGYIVKPNDFNKWKSIIAKAINLDWTIRKPHASMKDFILTEL